MVRLRTPQVQVVIDAAAPDAAAFVRLPVGRAVCLFDSRPPHRRTIDRDQADELIIIGNKHILIAAAVLLRKPLWDLAHKLANKELYDEVKGVVDDAGSAVASEIDKFIRNPPVTAVRLLWRATKFSVTAALALPKALPKLLKREKPPKPYVSLGPAGAKEPPAKGAKPAPPAGIISAQSAPAAGGQMPSVLQQLAAAGFRPPGAATSAPPAARPAPAAPAPTPSMASTPAKGLGAGLGGGLPPRPKPQEAAAPAAPAAPAPAAAKGLGLGLGGGLPSRGKPAEPAPATAAAAPAAKGLGLGLGGGLPARGRQPAPPAPAAAAEEEEEEEEEDEWEEADEDDMDGM